MTEIELSKQRKIAEIKKVTLISIFTESLKDSFYSFSVLSGFAMLSKEDFVEDSLKFSIQSKIFSEKINFLISLDFDVKEIIVLCEKLKEEYFRTYNDFEDFILNSCLKNSLLLTIDMVESFYKKNPDRNIEDFPLWDKISHFGNFVFTCKKFTKLILPTSLISIDDCAFSKCKKLEEIVIPDSVEKIGGNVFLGCSSLRKVHISKSLKTITEGTFTDCKSLTEIEIPNSVTKIEKNSFVGCSNLSKVSISKSVKEIDKSAFQGCRIENFEYKDFKIKNSLVFSDDNKILECCTNIDLERVELPETVKEIKDFAFADCKNLKSVKLPDSITKIGESVFNGCEILEEINLPSKISVIEKFSFYFCKKLKQIEIPKFVIEIKECAFADCSNLEKVVIPSSVEKISEEAFNHCAIEEFEFPSSLKIIDDSVFRDCKKLEKVKISSSVVEIKGDAFFGCDNLKTVIYEGTKEDWQKIKIDKTGNESLLKADIIFSR